MGAQTETTEEEEERAGVRVRHEKTPASCGGRLKVSPRIGRGGPDVGSRWAWGKHRTVEYPCTL
jgi:hypothetical protein